MIDEESKVWIVPILLLDYPALLDYPEVKNIALGSCTSGDYGLARKEIQKALHDITESTNYNLEMKLKYWDCLDVNLQCVISEDGNTIHTFGLWSDLECYKWQSEDDLNHLAEDRDPALEPTLTCQIIVQQILLFLGEKNTYTTLFGPTRLLISEIFPSKPDFHLHK